MRKITLNNLARMMEKPVMTVLAQAKMAKALLLNESSVNIYVDLDKYEAYLDKLINEDLQAINNY